MNLIFLLLEELDGEGVARLDMSDPRVVHIFEVLNCEKVKVALVGGAMCEASVVWQYGGSLSEAIVAVADQKQAELMCHRVDSAAVEEEMARSGGARNEKVNPVHVYCNNAKGVQEVHISSRRAGDRSYGRRVPLGSFDGLQPLRGLQLRIASLPRCSEPACPPFDLDILLACPRPKVLARLLPALATFGIRRIALVKAQKVEATYFDNKNLQEASIRESLVDGLSQGACYTRLPELKMFKDANFTRALRWLDENADTSAEGDAPRHVVRILAHPPEPGTRALRVAEHLQEKASSRPRVVLAVGPEGGWVHEELAVLEDEQFGRCALGPRILKTLDATISLLALVYDAVEEHCST